MKHFSIVAVQCSDNTMLYFYWKDQKICYTNSVQSASALWQIGVIVMIRIDLLTFSLPLESNSEQTTLQAVCGLMPLKFNRLHSTLFILGFWLNRKFSMKVKLSVIANCNIFSQLSRQQFIPDKIFKNTLWPLIHTILKIHSSIAALVYLSSRTSVHSRGPLFLQYIN